ncbi:MAG: transcriptional regulator NrdR [Kiritimatiellae bacterium]|nr:transcriptional regulator NrdR [Kiritimatiellia bacterium]
MRCPKCGHQDDKVLDSRAAREGLAIRRRRACLACGQRFTTYEEIVKDALRVVKRDGRHEEFSRLKLMSGIMRACEKRPVSPERIEELVDEIVEEIEQQFDATVPSQTIGEKVMQKLEKLDEVAYVRFASVYRRFADVNQFMNAIREVVDKT